MSLFEPIVMQDKDIQIVAIRDTSGICWNCDIFKLLHLRCRRCGRNLPLVKKVKLDLYVLVGKTLEWFGLWED